MFDLLPGAMRDSPAGKLQSLLPSPIVDKGNVGVVETTTVSLEDQPRIAPEEVRPEASITSFEQHVDLGLWQPLL